MVAFAIFRAAFSARAVRAVANQQLHHPTGGAIALPEDLQGRIDEFSTDQWVSLRFAGDAEVPARAREVLEL